MSYQLLTIPDCFHFEYIMLLGELVQLEVESVQHVCDFPRFKLSRNVCESDDYQQVRIHKAIFNFVTEARTYCRGRR